MKKKPIKNNTSKYVTEKSFESNMRSIANSFEQQGKVMEMMLGELREIREVGLKTDKTASPPPA